MANINPETQSISDLITTYISLKEKAQEIDEEIKAYETLILNDPSARDDDRLTFVAGRKTITIKDETYENLKLVGVVTTVTEVRNKKIDEFDVSIREIILSNPDNYIEKVGKESIRIKAKAKKGA